MCLSQNYSLLYHLKYNKTGITKDFILFKKKKKLVKLTSKTASVKIFPKK